MSTRTATWLAWALAGPIRQRAQQLGHQHRRRRGALHVLLGLPRHRGPDSLQASWKPIDWICLADGLLWALIVLSEDYSAYGLAIPGSVPFPVTMVVGARRGAARGLPASAVPGRAVTVQEVAPPGLALWGGDRVGERHRIRYSWASGGARGGAQPVRAGGTPLGGGCRVGYSPLLPLCMLASAMSLVLRYRRSGCEVRQQIKWITFDLLRRRACSQIHRRTPPRSVFPE
jgi:hypothetical protein